MIELHFSDIRDPRFNPLLTKLLQSSVPYAVAKQIVDLIHLVRKDQEKSDELWEMLSKKYLEPIDEKDQFSQMQIKASYPQSERARVMKEINDFMTTKVEIDLDPLPEEVMESLSFTGEEYLLLRKLIA